MQSQLLISQLKLLIYFFSVLLSFVLIFFVVVAVMELSSFLSSYQSVRREIYCCSIISSDFLRTSNQYSVSELSRKEIQHLAKKSFKLEPYWASAKLARHLFHFRQSVYIWRSHAFRFEETAPTSPFLQRNPSTYRTWTVESFPYFLSLCTLNS